MKLLFKKGYVWMSFRRHSDGYRLYPISSQDQSLSLQLDALHAAGCAKVFVEPASGLQSRPAPCRLLPMQRPLAERLRSTFQMLRRPGEGNDITDIDGPGQTLSLLGSNILLPATRAERKASGDPRPSIEERYPAKEAYLRRVQQAAEALVERGYLLAEDLPTITEQASQRYDLFQSRVG